MSRKDAIERINADPGRYLTPDKTGKGYVCPICGSGSGRHGTGITSKDGRHFTCWAGRCFTSATMFDILAIREGLDPSALSAADYERVLNGAGETPVSGDDRGSAPITPLKGLRPLRIHSNGRGETQAPSSYLQTCAARANQTDYFKARGLTEPTIQTYALGFDPAFKTKVGEEYQTWAAAVIPTGGGAYVLRNTNSQTSDDRIRKRGEARLFNQTALQDSDQPVFIVEGEFDALSILEVGGQAVSLGSVANVDKLVAAVKETPPQSPLILALDNDESGEKAQSALIDALDALSVPFDEANIAGEYNDPNEALTTNREDFARRVVMAQKRARDSAAIRTQEATENRRKAYLERHSTLSHLTGFLSSISDSVNTPALPTGFPKLDAALDGGLYEGLYILGAVSSLGKTTFVLQLADQVAEKGHDVLIFSLEMARYELIAKSVSRLSYLLASDRRDAKTARGVTDGKRYANYSEKEHQLLGEALRAYQTFAGRVFIREGIGNIGAAQIREAVEEHIKLTGNRPLVVVDYLQQLQSADPRATDKQNMDRSVMELKRISRDHKLPLIAISSFNRENYRQSANMAAFKESGGIEYSSDVLIALQPRGVGEDDFDAEEARAKDPRDVELIILKNRSAPAGARIPFSYYAVFNIFVELGDPAEKKSSRRI